ncbi:hypothetical protein FB45DRAFT_872110 [Roridomyces roridus]|uniref:Uncharacterized protein n=1 Tax=Roridomyces roridus TaxID=1738132 RepID=A0AAD7BF75_9AGAR|nr:hypothetical protein FB45DRAFT_872110 [Roridomyces roridus]
MRVAWRVKHWVEPILYRVIVVSHRPDTPEIQLSQGLPSLPLPKLFKKIEMAGPAFLPTQLFIEHHIQPHKLDKIVSEQPSTFHSLCSTTSHTSSYARITTRTWELRVGKSLEDGLLPYLTHLALHTREVTTALHPHIRAYKNRLKYILLVISGWLPLAYTHPDSDEDRFVLIRMKDFRRSWLRGAAGRGDRWSLAEEFLAKRKAGEIERSQYWVMESEDPGHFDDQSI